MASLIPLESAIKSAFRKKGTNDEFFGKLFEYCIDLELTSSIRDPFEKNEDFLVKEVTIFGEFIAITYIFYVNDVPLAYTVLSTSRDYSDLELNVTHEILPITGIVVDVENSPPEFKTLRDLYNQRFRGTFDNIYKYLSGYMKPLDIFMKLCLNVLVMRDYTQSELDELYGSLEAELDGIFEEKTRAYIDEIDLIHTETYDDFSAQQLVFQFENTYPGFGVDFNNGEGVPKLKSRIFVSGIIWETYTKDGLDFYNIVIDRENIYANNKKIIYKTDLAELTLEKACLIQMLSYSKNDVSSVKELYENNLHGSAYALEREMREKNYNNSDILLFMYLSVCIHKKLIDELSK